MSVCLPDCLLNISSICQFSIFWGIIASEEIIDNDKKMISNNEEILGLVLGKKGSKVGGELEWLLLLVMKSSELSKIHSRH